MGAPRGPRTMRLLPWIPLIMLLAVNAAPAVAAAGRARRWHPAGLHIDQPHGTGHTQAVLIDLVDTESPPDIDHATDPSPTDGVAPGPGVDGSGDHAAQSPPGPTDPSLDPLPAYEPVPRRTGSWLDILLSTVTCLAPLVVLAWTIVLLRRVFNPPRPS